MKKGETKRQPFWAHVEVRGSDDCWEWKGARRCDNPPCCNPSHLFLGTAKENTQDCIRKGRFNPDTVSARAAFAKKMEDPELRKAHGVHKLGRAHSPEHSARIATATGATVRYRNQAVVRYFAFGV